MLGRKSNSWKRWVAVATVAIAGMASPAYAQKQNDENQPPPYDVPALPRDGMSWVPWVFVFLFTACIMLVAFKNPHRGHQD